MFIKINENFYERGDSVAVFMAGVGTAEIFKVGKDNQEHLFSTAKTLTESGITIGVSAEDIRAGAGAKLYGKYFHTSTFDLKMTDAMFKLEYIAANVGSEIELGGDVFKTETKTAGADKKIELTNAVAMTCDGEIYAYAKKPSDEFYRTYIVDTDHKITVEDEGEYCVKYLYTNDNAKQLTVKANFVPDTLRVYLTMNLFSGDDKNPSTGTKIGTVTVMIPRFLLNGAQDLSMSMTGASTTSFEGSALAAAGGCAEGCEDEGIYAKIIEIIEDFNWRTEAITIVFDNAVVSVGEKIKDDVLVYALFLNMKPKLLEAGKDYELHSSDDGIKINGNHIEGTPTGEQVVISAIGINKFLGKKAMKIYKIEEEKKFGRLDETILEEFVLI